MSSLHDRALGGLYGLLVGDAVGVPYEFHRPENLPPLEAIELDPPRGFRRAHARVPVGTWSDDGAHALCLLASLLERGQLDLDDLGRRLVDWYRDGYMAVGGIVFDIGIQTQSALHRVIDGAPAREAGPSEERANGNGALMRALPLALWHRGSDAELVRDAHEQGLVTHGHARSQVCCALYCLWARATLAGEAHAWERATERLRALYAGRLPDHVEALEFHVRPDEPPGGGGTGYVVDCLKSARLACEAPTYEEIIKRAIALGHDTDTTACVAGGIAGIRHGIDGIPARWRERLRGEDLVAPLAAALVRELTKEEKEGCA